MDRRGYLGALGVGGALALAGCVDDSRGGDTAGAVDESGDGATTLTLATATTAYDSGLLDAVVPGFERAFGASVRMLPRGTSGSLETARSGDCDVVVVHARPLEDAFLRSGHGLNRRRLMVNDFLLVGPPDDPADAAGLDPAQAFRAVAEAEATFVSRGDNSGTHTKELNLWDAAGTDPGGDWYQETGTGMGEALNVANQQSAYTLSDRGTFISQRSEIDLTILVQGPIEDGPEILANPYGIMAVNPGVHENANYDLAMAYIGWITSPGAQDAISDYQMNGEQLFYPEAVSEDPNFQQYVPEGWSSDSADE
mgnify:CR=1 FL=1